MILSQRPCHTIADLRIRAKARIPRVAFDYVDGGAGSEAGLARNIAALRQVLLLPRALTGCETPDISRELFGTRHAAPFAVAPTGLTNIVWPGTDRALAAAATAAGIPYTISTPATSTLESLAGIATGARWFQLYVGRDVAIVDDLMGRAERAGAAVLFVTVDVPAPATRLRDIRNGLALPLKLSPRLLFDIARHPQWALATLREGAPHFANLAPYAKLAAGDKALASFMARQINGKLDWTDVQRIRERWPRKLVVKGIMRPEDALRAAEVGADGIVVSNHGGRQLDAAPASIDMLPIVKAAVRDRIAVLFDGGIRGGDDIVKAVALGADFVLVGRAFLYGAGALGPAAGAKRVIDILTQGIAETLAQIGCPSIAALGASFIAKPSTTSLRGIESDPLVA
jgi:isopentenyl diphosphate isomerase/L-lactate dehydrogenase-like FMN-dependent dehydrogenase